MKCSLAITKQETEHSKQEAEQSNHLAMIFDRTARLIYCYQGTDLKKEIREWCMFQIQPLNCQNKNCHGHFLSCYAERFQSGIGVEAAKLTLDQLEDVLTNNTVEARTSLGCNNEITRFLSPAPNDDYVNKGWLTAHDVALTRRRIASCTIGNVDQRTDDTLRVLRHWHPWLMEDYTASMSRGHHAPSTGVSKAGDLSEEAAAMILRYNALADDLHGFAMERFQLQLEEL